jgi:chemotaxis signal transduction protein
MVSEVASIPNMPDFVRGAINLRGRVMPLVDLRKRLGMVSASEETSEFIRLMMQREQDHKNWLAELEASVRERREFKLTTDPHNNPTTFG